MKAQHLAVVNGLTEKLRASKAELKSATEAVAMAEQARRQAEAELTATEEQLRAAQAALANEKQAHESTRTSLRTEAAARVKAESRIDQLVEGIRLMEAHGSQATHDVGNLRAIVRERDGNGRILVADVMVRPT